MTRKRIIFLLIPIVTAVVVVLNWMNSQSSHNQQSKAQETYEIDSIVPVLHKETRVIAYEGSIKQSANVNLTFSIDGILMSGDFPLEVGKIVRENDILFKLDLRLLFKELSTKKKELKAFAERLRDEIKTDHSDQKDTWESFTSNILPTKRLPQLPIFLEKSKNLDILAFMKAYEEVERLEARIDDYYVFAPSSGTIVSVKKKIGEQIRAGECVAQLAPFQICFAAFRVLKEDLGLLKLKDEVTLSLNKKKEKGRVVKISLSKDSSYATIECRLSQSSAKGDEKITLQLKRNSEWFYIPSYMLRKNSLWISRQGRFMKIHTTIMDWKKDSVAIKELKSGDFVLRKKQKSGVIACP